MEPARLDTIHIILLHGQALDSTLWGDAFVDGLGPYAVHRFDLLGHGSKEGAALTGGFDAIVDDVRASFAAAVPAAQRKLVIVVGHSLGAWVGARWAALHPEEVDGLLLVSAVLAMSAEERATFDAFAAALAGQESFPEPLARQIVEGRWLPGIDPAVQRRYVDFLSARAPAATVAVIRAIQAATPVDAASLAATVRFVRGGEDPVAPRRCGDVTVGRTHFPHVEAPAAVAREVHVLTHAALLLKGLRRTWVHGDADWFADLRDDAWIRFDEVTGAQGREGYETYVHELRERRSFDRVELTHYAGDRDALTLGATFSSGDERFTLWGLVRFRDGRIFRSYNVYPEAAARSPA
ncbi:MAG: alpha/beta fold hydrolase [Nannocystaceae bacterium]